MWNILSDVKKNLVWNIPLSMTLGLAGGYFFELKWLKQAVVPLTVLMIFPIMATLDIKAVFSQCSRRLQLTAQVINFIVIPFVGFVLGKLFLQDFPVLAFGLLLMSLLPTSSMTISWTGFAHGNVNVALKMSIIGLIAGPIIVPLYSKALMGQVVVMSVSKIFKQVGVIIFTPLFLGYLAQIFLTKKYGVQYFKTHIKPKFPLLATLGVLGIIFVAIALRAKLIVHNPGIILKLLLPLGLFYFINYALATLIARLLFSKNDALALVYGTVMRNLSVALALSMAAFGKQGSEIALVIAVAYLIQVKSAAWYSKIADKVFAVHGAVYNLKKA